MSAYSLLTISIVHSVSVFFSVLCHAFAGWCWGFSFDQLLCGPLKFISTSNGLSVFIQFLSRALCFKCKKRRAAFFSMSNIFRRGFGLVHSFCDSRFIVRPSKNDIYYVEPPRPKKNIRFVLFMRFMTFVSLFHILACFCIFPGNISFSGDTIIPSTFLVDKCVMGVKELWWKFVLTLTDIKWNDMSICRK